VETARAVVRADEAAVENMRLQLAYTQIRAPFDGRTGNLLIHQGNVVKANDVGNPLVVINRIHPIYVTFAVPEQELERIKRYRAIGALRVEAVTDQPDRAQRTPTEGLVDLEPKLTHVDLDDVLVAVVVEVPDVLEDRALRQHLARMAHQELQHGELARCQPDLGAAAADQVLRRIELEVARGEDRRTRSR